MLLCNAFSLNMLVSLSANVVIRPITVEDVRDFHRHEHLTSAVGHPDTARVFTNILGFDVPHNRLDITLNTSDRIIVGQYRGPRLKAGATELPKNASIGWALVVISEGRHAT